MKNKIFFLAFFFFLLFVSLFSVCIGSQFISPDKIFSIILGNKNLEIEKEIIIKIRMPRMLMSLFLGGALSLSGFLLQTYFQNPIAGPFVLGISSGSKMTVAFITVICLGRGMIFSSWALIFASLAGAFAVTLLIIGISQKVKSMSFLLIAGIMIGYICSSITDFIIAFADDADIANLRGWSQGSFSGMRMENVLVCVPIICGSFLISFFLSKPIGAFRLGENYAKSMGVNVRFFRAVLILISSILSASVTAFAGPISFVGVAVPFLIKSAVQSDEPSLLIPLCFVGGASFCIISDVLARTLFAPSELNVSVVTSIFGSPVVIFMLLKRRGHADD